VTDTEANINSLIDSLGPIDILINNAGVGLIGAAESCSLEQIQRVFDVNLLGVVKVTNAVLPGMRNRNTGSIITISSIVGPVPSMTQCFYSGSKAAVERYMAQLKNDLQDAEFNIVVANINAGPVVTNFAQSIAVGARFDAKETPYPQMEKKIESWRAKMK